MSRMNSSIEDNYRCLAGIVSLLINDINIKRIFNSQDIYTYILWGLGYCGRSFLELAKKSEFEPKYLVDKNLSIIIDGDNVKDPRNVDFDVDLVIVSPVDDYLNIKEFVNRKSRTRIVLLKDLVEELMVIPTKDN